MVRRKTEDLHTEDNYRVPPGIPIDSRGMQTFDPTANVSALNAASNRRQDDLRDALRDYLEGMRVADNRFQDYAREAESRLSKFQSESDSKRIDQLAAIQRIYETRIADMLRDSVQSTSTLVSDQLRQIQNTFNDRVAKLEQFRYESTGRTSVSDPALTDALSQMANAIAKLKTTSSESEGRSKGWADGWGVLIGFLGVGGGAILALLNK